MKKHADNGSVHGAARLELQNNHQSLRLNDSQHIHGDTHHETTHVEDNQLKKTTRTVDNRSFSYHSSRSQINTTTRNDDGKRKKDRHSYPANNYNLINLSPCGRPTGAIPKRHTTPMKIWRILNKYNLMSIFDVIVNPPDRNVWNSMVDEAIKSYWSQQMISEAADKSSMKYINSGCLYQWESRDSSATQIFI